MSPEQPLLEPFDGAEDKPRRSRDLRAVLLGVGIANLCGTVMILLNMALLNKSRSGGEGLYITSDFTLIPLVMGIVGEFYWRSTRPSGRRRFGLAAQTAAVAMVLAAFFLQEGAICLLMASPLLILIVWIGALFGAWVFSKADSRLRVSVLPLLLLLTVCDALSPHDYTNAVTDSVRIHAPPTQVWKYVAAYPEITAPPDYWLWRIGLPCPIQSTAASAFVGAERKCIFTRGVVFGERITECRPAERLTFIMTKQPNDPEIVNHLVLQRGRFQLRDNGDGTTTLIGTSWYRLNVYPAAYFDLWTRDIIRHVHRRVMTQIRTLAETQTAPALPRADAARNPQKKTL